MSQEEILLDELLDSSKAGSIDDTIKVFPDPAQLDPNKTSGRAHRTLLATMITRLKGWVKAELLGKAASVHTHTISEVDNLQTTLNGHNQRISENTTAIGQRVRYVNGQLLAPDGSTITVGSDFYFGPWVAQVFQTGWIAISSDGKKFWQCLTDHASAAEPVAEDVNWELVFESIEFDPATIQLEESFTFNGSTETPSERYLEDRVITAIDGGTLLGDVQISLDSAAYVAATPGFVIPANTRRKLRITYLTSQTTDCDLILRTRKA